MDGKHSSGPWEWRAEGESNHFSVLKAHDGIAGGPAIIARLRCEANARLIAAAPDLLEALRVVTAALQSCRIGMADSVARKLAGEMVEQARAAIAKATGE